MPYRFQELTETDIFDPTSLFQGAPFTQAKFYGDWQKDHLRVVRRFTAIRDEIVVAYFQLIKHHLIFGKSYLYIPYGPITNDISVAFFTALQIELRRITKEEDSVFMRLDFTPQITSDVLAQFFTTSKKFTYHSAYFQPRVEWFLKLTESEDQLLKNMHEKTRYSIRLAERKSITTEIITKDFNDYFEIFYELMIGTATRNRFSLHHRHYYQGVFKSLYSISNSYLSIAKYKDIVLAIDLIIVYGGTAHYVFGASSNEERARMPAHIAQWQAISFAKSLGLENYNFGAITSDEDTHDSWSGLTAFKKKFGGYEVRHSDFVDVVLSPFWYHLYNLRKLLKK
jgi:peptidoglycan pentaglycine glycine transferase (the first glycine)